MDDTCADACSVQALRGVNRLASQGYEMGTDNEIDEFEPYASARIFTYGEVDVAKLLVATLHAQRGPWPAPPASIVGPLFRQVRNLVWARSIQDFEGLLRELGREFRSLPRDNPPDIWQEVSSFASSGPPERQLADVFGDRLPSPRNGVMTKAVFARGLDSLDKRNWICRSTRQQRSRAYVHLTRSAQSRISERGLRDTLGDPEFPQELQQQVGAGSQPLAWPRMPMPMVRSLPDEWREWICEGRRRYVDRKAVEANRRGLSARKRAEIHGEIFGSEHFNPTDCAEDLTSTTAELFGLYGQFPDAPAPTGCDRPGTHPAELDVFLRCPKVRAWVLQKAKGICECCGNLGPFLSELGTAFLEVHHVQRLVDGGPDTVANCVAICPNCHRAMHFATREDAEECRKRVNQRLGTRGY